MVGVDTLVEQSSGRVMTARELARTSSSHSLLPVAMSLTALLPQGALQRGRVYGCVGMGATSLAVSLAARATQDGSWLAFVDMPTIGYAAVRDHGVALQRVVSVNTHSAGARWTRVVGAIIDGVDIVIVSSLHCSAADARRLVSRVQAQSAVLIVVGVSAHVTADVILRSESGSWRFGAHAHSRELTVSCHGRRAHLTSVQRLILPGAQGAVAGVESSSPS